MSLKPIPHPHNPSEPKKRDIDQKPQKSSVGNEKTCEEHNKIRKINSSSSAGTYIDRIVDSVKPEREDLKKYQAELSMQLDKLKATATYFMRESSSTVTRFETVSRKFIAKKLSPISEAQKNGSSTAASKKDDPKCPGERINPKGSAAPSSPSFYTRLISAVKKRKSTPSGKMADAPGRPMRYPYTYTAKVVQFPWKFMFANNWMFRYYVFAVGVCFPLFYKIGKMTRSPENVKKWEEIRRRDFSGHH